MGVQIVSWGTRNGGRRVSGHDEPWKLNIHLQSSTSIFLKDTENILPQAEPQRWLYAVAATELDNCRWIGYVTYRM